MKNKILWLGAAVVIALNMATLFKVNKVSDEVQELKEDVTTLKTVVLYKTNQIKLTEQEFDCLARNVFHEAGVEPKEGKIAVAQVTYNRLKSGRWGNDICKVVYAKAQFSWTLYKKKRYQQPKGPLWEQSVQAANEFVKGQRVRGLEGSKFYHTDYIAQPGWAKHKQVVHKVGQHIFYKQVDKQSI